MLLLAGCSTTTGSNSSGTGADTGPWPTKPNRNSQLKSSDIDKVVSVPLWTMVKCQLAENEELSFNIELIDLKNDKQQKVPVSTLKDFMVLNPSGLHFNDKLQTQVVASQNIKKYKYTQLKFKINSTDSYFKNDKHKFLVKDFEVSIPLSNWVPYEPTNDIKLNVLELNLNRDSLIFDNEKKTIEIKPDAISVSFPSPTGAITGKVSSFMPSTRVIALFNGTSLEAGSIVPSSIDGTFSIYGLPAGKYKIKIITGADIMYFDKLIDVKDKMVNIKEIKIKETSI